MLDNVQTTIFDSGVQRRAEKTTGNSDWLANRLQRGKMGVFSEIVTITPELASLLLERNTENRSILARNVERMAEDIRGGQWDLNGESIKIAKSGEVNDGQHRLSAIALAGIPVRSVITFGLDRDTRLTLDTGAVRTTAHFLRMAGSTVSNPLAAAAICMQLCMYERRTFTWANVTKKMQQQVYWDNQSLIDDAVQLIGHWAEGKRVIGGSGTIGAALVILMRDRDAADLEFVHQVVVGHNLDVGHPALAVRNRLLTSKARISQPHRLEIVLRGYRIWKSGKTARSIPAHGRWPDMERSA